jgi:hypothetical protein
MAFDLRVSFTGLCAFVPNAAFDQKPTKVCVALPNGEGNAPHPKKSLDGTELDRHRAFLRFDLKNLKGMPKVPSDSLAAWYLTRREVTFTTTGKSNPLTIASYKEAADLTKVAPNYSVVDPAVVTGDTLKITSRLIIEHGEISTDQLTGPWRTTKTLADNFAQFPKLAQQLVLKLTGLDSLEISVKKMTGGTDQDPLQLEAPRGGTVNISILNLCDTNPLQWEPRLASTPDADFKWYFELLPDKQIKALAKVLLGLELPILVPEGQPNGLGQNCFPALTGAINF